MHSKIRGMRCAFRVSSFVKRPTRAITQSPSERRKRFLALNFVTQEDMIMEDAYMSSSHLAAALVQKLLETMLLVWTGREGSENSKDHLTHFLVYLGASSGRLVAAQTACIKDVLGVSSQRRSCVNAKGIYFCRTSAHKYSKRH